MSSPDPSPAQSYVAPAWNPGEFLRIYHDDSISAEASHQLCLQKRSGELDERYAKYVVENGDVSIGGKVLLDGYHTVGWDVLSLHSPREWLVGSNTGVDVLLALPISRAAGLMQKIVIVVAMNPTSGA